MNKKLIVLIVALECVFAIFLISVFGPVIASLHEDIPVSEIYLIDENGERLVPEEGKTLPSVSISLPGDLDYYFTLEILDEKATDKSVTVTTDNPEVTVLMDRNGRGFTVTFENPTLKSVTVTVTANDGSAKTASVYIEKAGGSTNVPGIFG